MPPAITSSPCSGDTVERRAVKTGNSTVDPVQVTEGLAEGDAVALPSDVPLAGGSRVTPLMRIGRALARHRQFRNNSSFMSTPASPVRPAKYAWYRDLTGYHWFVLSVASMGWMFDTMAQQLFNLARNPAIRDLLGGQASGRRGGRAGRHAPPASS